MVTSDDPLLTQSETARSLDLASGGRLEARVLAERVRLLYARNGVALATVVVNSTIVIFVFWGAAPAAPSLAWLAFLWALSGLRMALALSYAKHTPGPQEASRWALWFTLGAAANGLAWGFSSILFYPYGNLAEQIFLAFVLGGMAAGSAASNASHPPAFAAFTAPVLLPLAVRFSIGGDRIHVAMGFMTALFGVAVAMISRTGSRALSRSIRLRMDNEGLVEHLTAAQERLATLNASLEQRVSERTAELARALDELAQTRVLASVGGLAAGVAHEINNPLTYVLSNLTFVRDRVARTGSYPAEETDSLASVVDEAIVGATRVRDIVHALGFLSRRDTSATGPTELHPLLDSCIEVAMSEIRHRARVVRDFASVPPVRGSHNHLSHVFLNLLLNAAEAIREGSPGSNVVRVSTRWAGGASPVQVEVADTGVGVPEGIRDRIFEPFFTTKPVGGGTGLGLSVCHGIVTALGGTISVRSRAGEGSVFTVSLPLAEPPTASEPVLD